MFDITANCPHCGAPIDSVVCPYCGTRFIDFANIDMKTPTYLRVKWDENQVAVFKAQLQTITFSQEPDALPVFTSEFHILPVRDESDHEVYMKILAQQTE